MPDPLLPNDSPRPPMGSDGNGRSGNELERLRQLLLVNERQKLAELEARLQPPDPQEVSDVLPCAVQLAATNSERLKRSLGPLIGESLRDSIQRDPQSIADAISPIMGPAIRQSIRKTFEGIIQSFNQTLEHSFSPQSLRWRLEAWQTGRPFAEVVVIKTMLYKIEHVFLCHRETGLLLANASDLTASHKFPDIVSSMLTAIQDFVRDSFEGQRDDVVDVVRWRGEDADDPELGSRYLWVENGPQALMVAVIRGEAPHQVRDRMCEVVERFHIDFADALADFKGDNEPFLATEQDLADCLLSEKRPTSQKSSQGVRKIVIRTAALLVLLAGLGASGWLWFVHERFERISHRLSPPPTIDLRLEGRTVVAAGTAHHDWLQQARATDLPGDYVLDTQGVTNLDAAWLKTLADLEGEPGIRILTSQRKGSRYHLMGLRDPLAADPAEIAQKAGMNLRSLHDEWATFQSLDPGMVIARTRRVLNPPPSVQLAWEGHTIKVTGSAHQSWIEQARLQAATIPGVESVQFDTVSNLDDVWPQVVALWDAEPGIVVVRSGPNKGRYFVTGLHDPLARNPTEVIAGGPVDASQIDQQWKPYTSLDDAIVTKRLTRNLEVPDTVTLDFRHGELRVTGEASHEWIQKLFAEVNRSEIVQQLDSDQLVDVDLERIKPIQQAIEQAVIFFAKNRSEPPDSQMTRIDQVAELVNSLLQEAESVGKRPIIELVGYASADEGDSAATVTLSEMRAKLVWQALVNRDIPGNIFVIKGSGLQFARSPDGISVRTEAQRRVVLRVRLGFWDP